MPLEIPSIHAISTFASGLLSQLPFGAFQHPSRTYVPYGNAPSCPIDSPLSCHNNTEAPDSCCFIYPGGQLLQTQFWDTSPAIGPDDSWTLHGLWYGPILHRRPRMKLTGRQARSLRRQIPAILHQRPNIQQYFRHHLRLLKSRTPFFHEFILAAKFRDPGDFLGA